MPTQRIDDMARDAVYTGLVEAEPEMERFLEISPHSLPHIAASPSGQTLLGGKPSFTSLVYVHPVMANIEITTRCMLSCPHCARTFLKREARDMTEETFNEILNKLPHAYRITLVGLGEPLLHPKIAGFIAKASSQGRRVALVTNGMGLSSALSQELLDAGLASMAFSMDSAESEIVSEVRKGSDLPAILENAKIFIEKAKSTGKASTAFFTAVSVKTLPYLKGLFDCAKTLGVQVVMLTDLNFEKNISETLWKNINPENDELLRRAVVYAFSKELPVLSVHGLEEFGLPRRYRKFILLPPSGLYNRSIRRTWCCSPWQTIPVDIDGQVTICDCQPEQRVGNLLSDPLDRIWNSEILVTHRNAMQSSEPPKACALCPRF